MAGQQTLLVQTVNMSNHPPFFAQQHSHFFRPLTSKYRGMAVECLKLLYQRFYSSMADYGQAINREQIIDLFQTALTRVPELDAETESEETESETRFRNDRERATWILSTLVEHGWLEVQIDEITLLSSYQFSQAGRLFTQPFVELSRASVRTRHRNTRNTRNALNAFLADGEVHDLLDACEYSERIISDFTDIIAELEARKRKLANEAEAASLAQIASDEFFDFMDKRFQPDLSVRLSADSVEKHRDEIFDLIQQVRNTEKPFKAEAERQLRQLLPDQIVPGQSLLWSLLDGIELRLANACAIMLPSLRTALRSFTRRADIIIRQMSYLATQKHSSIVKVCQEFKKASPDEQAMRLEAVGDMLSSVHLALIDPQQITVKDHYKKQEVNTLVAELEPLDQSAYKDIFIQNALDRAFIINDESIRDYLVDTLKAGKAVHTKDLPIQSASDLLAATHAIELGSVSSQFSTTSSDFLFDVTPTKETVSTPFLHQADNFIIEVRTKNTK